MASEVRFAVVRKILESNGWRLIRISSSHHVFKKPGSEQISIPVHGQRVKATYVKKIEKIIAQEGGQPRA